MRIDRADCRSSLPPPFRHPARGDAPLSRSPPRLPARRLHGIFFRDPERVDSSGTGLVVSPADGRVMIAGPKRRPLVAARLVETDHDFSIADGRAHQSHAGLRAGHRVDYRPGKFLPAYNEGSNGNELNEVWIDHDDRRSCSARSSASSRAGSCRAHEGQVLERGERVVPDEIRITDGCISADRCDAPCRRRRSGDRRRNGSGGAWERSWSIIRRAAVVAKIGP
jgi:hypothetical protein